VVLCFVGEERRAGFCMIVSLVGEKGALVSLPGGTFVDGDLCQVSGRGFFLILYGEI